MDDRVWADRFDRDVEVLLKKAGRTDSEPLPGGYVDAVDLAGVLATTDFSVESAIRQTLRRRLLTGIYRGDGSTARGPATGHALPNLLRGRRALAGATLLLVGVLVLTVPWLDSLKAALQGMQTSWQRLVPREYLVERQSGSSASAAVSVSAAPRLGAASRSVALMRTAPAVPAPRRATPIVAQRSEAGPSSPAPTPPRLTSSQMGVPLCTIPAPLGER